MQRFDAVMDLQNHRISKIIRKVLRAKAWVEFDRSSSLSAGRRTQNTIEALWSWRIEPETFFQSRQPGRADVLLQQAGYREQHKLVVLNPAGYCPSRHWPLSAYEAFARRWQVAYPLTQFVLLLLPAHQEAATYLETRLGDHCLNLTGKADPVEAFEILQRCDFMLTEDSGLMHMAWVQGIPTLALFSSSRKDWSAPQGAWSMCLDSSDLECGPCLLPVCKFDDNRCLTRYTPEFVMACAEKILPHAKPHRHVSA
nr:glycosyltransferase family 9 protein [Chryseolinea lacunae]